MIQTVEQPDGAVLSEVTDYVTGSPESWGASPEHDPRWLDVLNDGLGHRSFMLIARCSGQVAPVVERGDQISSGHLHAPGKKTPHRRDSSTGNLPVAIEARTASSSVTGVNQGKICGYLPLALVESRLFGRFLVSLPYLNRAGIVALDDIVASQLVDRAVELAREQNVKYLELRNHGQGAQRFSRHPQIGVSRADKVRMVLRLPESVESLWQRIGPKVRNQIRKGEKNQLKIRWGGLERLDDFYEVFAVNMRDLGTPVYPRKLFASILHHFFGQAELAIVDYQSQVVAAALLVHDRGSTQVPSASSLREHSRTNANMWMYHQLLLRAMARGSQSFDFGRSSEDSGTYRFKKQWGANPHPTVWHYHVRHGDLGAMRPDSLRNRRRVAVWKKLPVWLTRCIGPAIVRGIP